MLSALYCTCTFAIIFLVNKNLGELRPKNLLKSIKTCFKAKKMFTSTKKMQDLHQQHDSNFII